MNVRSTSISLYSEIARENAEKLVSIQAQVNALEARIANTSAPDEFPELEFELMSLQDLRGKYASIVIVFSAIAVEAYIYDYAARHLSDKFVQSYLDKLDLVSKWIIVPRLITGKSLPQSGKWMMLLKALVKERNSIVHSKSKEPPFELKEAKDFYKKLNERNAFILQKSRQAIELLDELTTEISNLDPEEAPWVEIHFN
jgi:hypothetical protein